MTSQGATPIPIRVIRGGKSNRFVRVVLQECEADDRGPGYTVLEERADLRVQHAVITIGDRSGTGTCFYVDAGRLA